MLLEIGIQLASFGLPDMDNLKKTSISVFNDHLSAPFLYLSLLAMYMHSLIYVYVFTYIYIYQGHILNKDL